MHYPRITGDNLDYLYDRDQNTKSFNLSGYHYASYGTKVSFTNRIGEIRGRDNVSSKYPIGLNSLMAKIDLKIGDINEAEAGILVGAIQEVLAEEGTGAGYLTLTNNSSSPISTGSATNIYLNLDGGTGDFIYNEINGLLVEDYEVVHKSNFLHDLNIVLKTNQKSVFTNYWGAHSYSGGLAYWDTGIAYEENDIIFYPAFENARDNFFYCSSGHISITGLAPNASGSPWKQSFFWEPNHELTTRNGDSLSLENFKEGMHSRTKVNKNSQFIDTTLSFLNRSNKETRAILHFLENRMGYKAFDFTLSGIYRSKKYFTAPEWEHEFVYFDVNNISVKIKEEVRVASAKQLNTSNFWNAL